MRLLTRVVTANLGDNMDYLWMTVKPLIFNNPATGQVETIPAGEPCKLVESVDEAKRSGLLQDPMAIWAAETNLKRGYSLVLLRGMLRGVDCDDIAPRRRTGVSSPGR